MKPFNTGLVVDARHLAQWPKGYAYTNGRVEHSLEQHKYIKGINAFVWRIDIYIIYNVRKGLLAHMPL